MSPSPKYPNVFFLDNIFQASGNKLFVAASQTICKRISAGRRPKMQALLSKVPYSKDILAKN
jgi:hypothetical protein